MISPVDLLNPRKAYELQLKEDHHKNASDFFDELAKKSNINIEENRATVKNYYKTQKDLDNSKSQRDKKKALKTFLYLFAVLLIILAVVMFFLMFTDDESFAVKLIIACVSLPLAFLIIYLTKKKINPQIKEFDTIIEKIEKNAGELLKTAYEQMSGLNNSYDWGMCARLVTKTCPLIELDENFQPSKAEFLRERFGFSEYESSETTASTCFVQSGSILGNPFVFQKVYIQGMVDTTYSNSIVITWTEYQTVNGKRQAVTRSQTLTAYVTRPAPNYYYETWLIYGNDAAPKLSFSRKPSNANNMDEKEIERYVKQSEKTLDKMVREDIGDKAGSQFTALSNTKFEALFRAFNRDNEVEFRLLFTPLAQQSMINLITTKEPYGDDFVFVKKKKVNFIKTEHGQKHDITAAPTNFTHFDYEYAKKHFVDFNDEYFKSMFFDFAPLLSIPLYQQHKTPEYIYKDTYRSNTTMFEQETLANAFDHSVFAHPDSDTDVILKAGNVVKEGKKDIVSISAHSFQKIEKIENVSKLGGDGRWHTIPVTYYEFEPLEQVTEIVTENVNDSSQNDSIGAIIKQRGLLAYIRDSLNNN